MSRISQIYRDGVCVYYVFSIEMNPNCLKIGKHIREHLKEVSINSGGSLSHHHGVGSDSAKLFVSHLPKFKHELWRQFKEFLDPNGVFQAVNFTNKRTEELKSKL